jgi:hypothetical protein
MKTNLNFPAVGLKALALLTSIALGSAFAAPLISAQSIIVNPVDDGLTVKVWTDRDSSGNAAPDYRVGERIRLYAKVNQDAYIYLFNVDPAGKIDMILPNRLQGGASFMRADETKSFPANGAKFFYTVGDDGGYGINKVLAVVSKNQLNLNDIARFKNNQAQFADVQVSGQNNLAQALSIVVNPIPSEEWYSDTALYTVVNRSGNAPSNPNTGGQASSGMGSVVITTNISNAEVFVADRRAGRGSITVSDLAAGSYKITVRARGYADYVINVTVSGGKSVTVTANF